MKTAISIPDDIFETAEAFARERQLSRSALFTRAVKEFLSLHRRDDVTERLNRVYAEEDARLDPVLDRLQRAALAKEDW